MKPALVYALYVFCAEYHTGQGSRLYRLGSRVNMRYRPRLSDRAWNAISTGLRASDWQEERELYRALEKKYADDRK